VAASSVIGKLTQSESCDDSFQAPVSPDDREQPLGPNDRINT
jgi:hypothetical protein